MIPKPHHKQFYIKASEQRNKCLHRKLETRRWNISAILNNLAKNELDFRSNHYWFKNLMQILGERPIGH